MGHAALLRLALLWCCLQIALFTDPACVIELECRECVPDNMPLVSAKAERGRIAAPRGQPLRLACGAGRFLAYPQHAEIAVACEAGRWRVQHDGRLRHLLELGCQENIFEDVLHEVSQCGAPLQGRAYVRQGAGGEAHHVATVCFDPERGVAVRARVTSAPLNELPLPPHSDRLAPLSLLGNFNHMFDAKTRHEAESLYADDERLTRRFAELLRHDNVALAGETLTAAELLPAAYFEDQNARVSQFASNRFAAWRSVARGNLRHAQRDVARALRRPGSALEAWAGTRGALAPRTGRGRVPLALRGERFPVPRYVWTVVVDARRRRALAVAVLNDPFVAVSEIADAVFCASACGAVGWLRDLRRNRNYETPLLGLAFCCSLRNFTRVADELPAALVAEAADYALLTDLPDEGD